jgi:hypothetical protein
MPVKLKNRIGSGGGISWLPYLAPALIFYIVFMA